jgi:hypothetical protein
MAEGLRCAQRREWVRLRLSTGAFGCKARLFLTVISLTFVGVAQGAVELKPKPAWNVLEAPSRLLVEKSDDDLFLVQLPVAVGVRPVAAVRVFVSSNEVPARVVWSDASAVTVLVDARTAKRMQMVKIYPVPGAARVVAGLSPLSDPEPLRGRARRTAGMDFPASLADVKTLETRCDTKDEWFTVADFSKLGGTFKSWFKGDWTR